MGSLRTDTRGATMVEYLIILAIVGVAAIGAWSLFGTSVGDSTDDQSEHIAAMSGSGTGSGGTSVSGAPAALTGDPTAPVAPESGDDDGGGGFWGGVGDFFSGAGSFLWGTGSGIVGAAWDTVTGLGSLVWSIGEGAVWVVTNPGEAWDGLVYGVTHPGEVASAAWDFGGRLVSGIGTALGNAWDTLLHGTWEERGDIVGRVVFEVALTIGTGGAGHATKARYLGKVDDLADAARIAENVDDVGDAARIAENADDIARAGTVPARIASGLSRQIDDALERMPALRGDVDALQRDGWTIRYGDEGGGSWANKDTREIVVEPNRSVADQLRTLAHETGHARYTVDPYVPPTGLTREEYVRQNVNRHLKDEGEATLRQIEAAREMDSTRGFFDRVLGRNRVAGSRGEYERIYDDYLQHGDRDRARQEIADRFGQETTSTTREGYIDYYGKPYEEFWKNNVQPTTTGGGG